MTCHRLHLLPRLFSIEFVLALELETTMHRLVGEGFSLFRSIVFHSLLGGTALIDGPQVGPLFSGHLLAAVFGAIGPTGLLLQDVDDGVIPAGTWGSGFGAIGSGYLLQDDGVAPAGAGTSEDVRHGPLFFEFVTEEGLNLFRPIVFHRLQGRRAMIDGLQVGPPSSRHPPIAGLGAIAGHLLQDANDGIVPGEDIGRTRTSSSCLHFGVLIPVLALMLHTTLGFGLDRKFTSRGVRRCFRVSDRRLKRP